MSSETKNDWNSIDWQERAHEAERKLGEQLLRKAQLERQLNRLREETDAAFASLTTTLNQSTEALEAANGQLDEMDETMGLLIRRVDTAERVAASQAVRASKAEEKLEAIGLICSDDEPESPAQAARTGLYDPTTALLAARPHLSSVYDQEMEPIPLEEDGPCS